MTAFLLVWMTDCWNIGMIEWWNVEILEWENYGRMEWHDVLIALKQGTVQRPRPLEFIEGRGQAKNVGRERKVYLIIPNLLWVMKWLVEVLIGSSCVGFWVNAQVASRERERVKRVKRVQTDFSTWPSPKVGAG